MSRPQTPLNETSLKTATFRIPPESRIGQGKGAVSLSWSARRYPKLMTMGIQKAENR